LDLHIGWLLRWFRSVHMTADVMSGEKEEKPEEKIIIKKNF
jgi:hypothetical protein